jgi:hypothetical protein
VKEEGIREEPKERTDEGVRPLGKGGSLNDFMTRVFSAFVSLLILPVRLFPMYLFWSHSLQRMYIRGENDSGIPTPIR